MQEITKQLHETFYTWLTFPRATAFIRHHKLWLGMKEYQWVYRFLLVVAGLAGMYLVAEYFSYTGSHADESVINTLFASNGFLYQFGGETYESMTSGALKWVILVLLEVVIYHFMRQSLRIVANKDVENAHTFKPFFEAQKRMLQVSVMAYILEIILIGVVGKLFFYMFTSFAFLQPLFDLLVQSILIGFAIVDNYNEQYGLTIRQSLRYARIKCMGILIGVGFPLFLILKIPFLGAMLGPILCSVVVAIVMFELSDLATVGYVPSPEEQEAIDRKKAKAARKSKR